MLDMELQSHTILHNNNTPYHTPQPPVYSETHIYDSNGDDKYNDDNYNDDDDDGVIGVQTGYTKDNDEEENFEQHARSAMRKISWRMLPILAFVFSISATEKTNISLAAEGMMEDLNINTKQFGLASSLYFVPYGLLAVPSGKVQKSISFNA